jgi:hypothetical protein
MPTNPNPDLPGRDKADIPRDVRMPEETPQKPQLADVADPADEIPVPIAMSPAEIDERAQAVEAVRSNQDLEPRIDV